MLRNILIAYRFLTKQKNYTLINISGLLLAFTSVLLIGLYINDEMSFDAFHSKRDRIYRLVEFQHSENGKAEKVADVAFRLSTLPAELPAIESAAKITTFGRANFSTDANDYKSYEDFTVSEQSFFEIFDFRFLYGSKHEALKASHSVVVTRSTALRFFGTEDAVGKLIKTDRDDQPFKVTAVIEDLPSNSHLQGDMIFSLETFKNADWYSRLLNDWSSNSFSTYILTKNDINPHSLSKAITDIVVRNEPQKKNTAAITLQPLRDIHFHSGDISGGIASLPGEIYYIYLFSAVGLFIMVIAIINYINLSTSLALTRGKEVGVKKMAGAERKTLIFQFLTESILIAFLALILSIVLANALLPAFNEFTDKDIDLHKIFQPVTGILLISVTIIIGTLSGSYPAFVLSGYKPISAIKGLTSITRQGLGRNSLVVFQFALSIMLILATLVAYQQLSFVQNKDLGFTKNQLMVLDINSSAVRKNFQSLKNEMMKIPNVQDVTVSSRVPGEWKNLPQVLTVTDRAEKSELYFLGIDENFLKTFDIKLLSGKNFTGETSDSLSFLINETAAREMGINIDESLSIEEVNMNVSFEKLDTPFKGRITGIVKDFHFQSLHQKIQPLLLAWHKNPIHSIDYFTARINTHDIKSTVAALEKTFQQIDQTHLIEYNFLDQKFESFYAADVMRGKLFAIAALISIGLACLGLFSLASFMTARKTKEIGIRKALGATSQQIVIMLSSHYIKLVSIAFVIALPFGIWSLNLWLTNFAYRIDITFITILASCMIALTIALLTVGIKSVTAALANPVKSLRSE